MFWCLVLFWLTAVARVVLAFVENEVFGTEATLALAVAIIVPWLVKDRLGFGRLR